jgi:hypothetical protein
MAIVVRERAPFASIPEMPFGDARDRERWHANLTPEQRGQSMRLTHHPCPLPGPL